MTSLENPEPLTELDDVCELWDALLRGVEQHGRSLWLMPHDSTGRPVKHVVTIDDLPLTPDDLDPRHLTRLVEELCSHVPGGGVLALLSRPGTGREAPFEVEWSRLVQRAGGAALTWPVCCATPQGVRPVSQPHAASA